MEASLKNLLDRGEVIEIRGDGKAGSGLLMVMQTFAKALGRIGGMEIQEWPLFSSSRKGANVRGFLRIANHPIQSAAAVVHPHLAILMDESVASNVDFASGVENGIFVLNTTRSAQEAADKYGLTGTVVAVDGKKISEKFFDHKLANIPVYGALVRMSGCLTDDEGESILLETMKKRRLPEKIQKANSAAYRMSLASMDVALTKSTGVRHLAENFEKYPPLPKGAQSRLRTSLGNKTSQYRPVGLRLKFEDPYNKCNGCSLCVLHCPENIIAWIPDPKGLKVTGANVADFCKLCRECIEVCPVELFSSVKDEAA
jgi:pyruvate ferredoxin oxidoreductase gamma subunit